MSALKQVARHLHDLTEYNPAHVAVMMIDADGTTRSFFYGDTEGAAQALTLLPEAAQELAGNLSAEAGITIQPTQNCGGPPVRCLM